MDRVACVTKMETLSTSNLTPSKTSSIGSDLRVLIQGSSTGTVSMQRSPQQRAINFTWKSQAAFNHLLIQTRRGASSPAHDAATQSPRAICMHMLKEEHSGKPNLSRIVQVTHTEKRFQQRTMKKQLMHIRSQHTRVAVGRPWEPLDLLRLCWRISLPTPCQGNLFHITQLVVPAFGHPGNPMAIPMDSPSFPVTMSSYDHACGNSYGVAPASRLVDILDGCAYGAASAC